MPRAANGGIARFGPRRRIGVVDEVDGPPMRVDAYFAGFGRGRATRLRRILPRLGARRHRCRWQAAVGIRYEHDGGITEPRRLDHLFLECEAA